MGDLMSNDALQVLAEFRSETPYPSDNVARAVFARAVGSSPARPHRRRLALVTVLAVLAFSAAAVAAVKNAPWWQSGAPPVDPQAVVAVARGNMPANVRVSEARTVVTDHDAALVAVPLDETGYCLIPTLGGHAAFDAPCIYTVARPESGDSDISETAASVGSKGAPARWLAYGRITDPRAAKLDLGAFSVGLAPGGFFLTEVPAGMWAKLSGTASRGAILDASGAVLRRGCVSWGTSPDDSPTGALRAARTVLWLDQPAGTCKPVTVPPPPTLDLSKASTLFDVTLTQPFATWKAGDRVTFEEAPASDGGTCVVMVGPGYPITSSGQHCGWRLDQSLSTGSPINVGFGNMLAHDGGKAFYSWQIMGSTDPGAKIAKLTLSSPSSKLDVTYRDTVFFVQLPATTPGPRVGSVPFPGGPWTLTGYDAGGSVVAHVDLNALYEHSSPH
jgi:hypothetical protein